MSSTTIFLSRLLGLYCLIMGLTMATRGSDFVDTLTLVLRDAPLMLTLGMITLVAGLSLVLVHNHWSGGPVTLLITVLSWLTLAKGLALVLLNKDVATILFVNVLVYREYFEFYTGTFIVLGLYLTYAGFTKKP